MANPAIRAYGGGRGCTPKRGARKGTIERALSENEAKVVLDLYDLYRFATTPFDGEVLRRLPC